MNHHIKVINLQIKIQNMIISIKNCSYKQKEGLLLKIKKISFKD